MNIVKVCHLTSVHPPFDVRIFYKECKTLSNNHYEVVLIAPHRRDDIIDNVRIRSVNKPKNRSERLKKTIWRLYKATIYEDADVCHLHDPELIPVGILLKLRGMKVIYDVHEDYPRSIQHSDREWIHQWLRKPVAILMGIAEKIGSKMFTGIVAATPSIALRFPTSKTVIVQNFPITENHAFINTLPYKNRRPHLAYIGTISQLRGISELMAAMSLLPPDLDATLKLAGTFSPPSLEENLTTKLNCMRVDFLGWQTHDKITELLGQCRVGLVTLHPTESYLNSYPVKLFEYMCAGLPVVASDFPLWRKIIEQSNCGLLVDPHSPKAIADAIEWMLGHPDEAEQMGKQGKEAVLSLYNWDIEAKKLLSIYEKILS